MPKLFLCFSDKIDWLKNDFMFIVKKILDCIVYLLIYMFVVYTNYLMTMKLICKSLVLINITCFSLISIFNLYIFTKQLVDFRSVAVVSNKKIFCITLISLLIGILSTLSTINYVIYMICPNMYKIQDCLSFIETAFEFIYYSFTIAVTYSSSSISVVHIITKLVQIFEICYCYVLCGSIIIQLIEKPQKTDSNNKE